MSGFVDKATSALIARLQFGKFYTRDGTKIADITHADTTEHTLTPSALGLPANVVALLISPVRASGTGVFALFSKSSGSDMRLNTAIPGTWPIDDTGVFRYRLTAANDDWDIYCFGYWTEGAVIE